MKRLLDTNILTRLCHPHKDVNLGLNEWLEKILGSGPITVIIPEIADYEVRRGLIHVALKSGQPTTRSLLRLDHLTEKLEYLPLNTATMRRAAGLWAESRLAGLPTAVEVALDGDVLLEGRRLKFRASWSPKTSGTSHVLWRAAAGRLSRLTLRFDQDEGMTDEHESATSSSRSLCSLALGT